jgi:hypothetical protein
MNANDVIESYVTDVALLLPRRQRNDVAFELRALIDEGLQDRAEAEGRAIDAAMATDFLQAFGRPRDVAARYRPTLTIIDPADGHRFLRATVIGLAIIWCLGLLERLQQPIGSGAELLGVIAQWWLGTVVASLWWPGVLVAGFGTAAWVRRRWPNAAAWTPRSRDRLQGGRVGTAMALVGMLCGTYVLLDPRVVLDVVWNGRAALVAYEALTYTETFLHRQAPWVLATLLLNIAVFMVVIAMGRWSAVMRRIETGLSLITCALLAWTVLDGPVFMSARSDGTAKFLLALIVAYTLIHFAVKAYRRIRPMPDRRLHAQR